MKLRVLVTGGQGFVGKALASAALSRGFVTRISSRRALTEPQSQVEFSQVLDIGPGTNWMAALQEVDVVVHCAGRAHVMNNAAADSLKKFTTVNTAGTLSLAHQAVAAGVKRFV